MLSVTVIRTLRSVSVADIGLKDIGLLHIRAPCKS